MKRTQRTTGFGSPAESYAENDIDWNTLLFPKPHAMYIFSISGSGHEEYKICDEDLAIIDCSLIPKVGDLIVYTIDGEFSIGKYTGTEIEVVGVVSRLVRLLRSS
jgi:DNA polymerase V